MSVQAVSFILGERRHGVWLTPPHPSRGSDRLVMIAIANHAGEETFEAWPSIGLIASEAGLSKQRAQIAVRRCVEAGWLDREINKAPDERIPADRRPNLYQIVTGSGVYESDTPSAQENADGGPDARAPRGIRSARPNRQDQPSSEPVSSRPSPHARGDQADDDFVHRVAVARCQHAGKEPKPSYVAAVIRDFDLVRLRQLEAQGYDPGQVSRLLDRAPSPEETAERVERPDEATARAERARMAANAAAALDDPDPDLPAPAAAAPLIDAARRARKAARGPASRLASVQDPSPATKENTDEP